MTAYLRRNTLSSGDFCSLTPSSLSLSCSYLNRERVDLPRRRDCVLYNPIGVRPNITQAKQKATDCVAFSFLVFFSTRIDFYSRELINCCADLPDFPPPLISHWRAFCSKVFSSISTPCFLANSLTISKNSCMLGQP